MNHRSDRIKHDGTNALHQCIHQQPPETGLACRSGRLSFGVHLFAEIGKALLKLLEVCLLLLKGSPLPAEFGAIFLQLGLEPVQFQGVLPGVRPITDVQVNLDPVGQPHGPFFLLVQPAVLLLDEIALAVHRGGTLVDLPFEFIEGGQVIPTRSIVPEQFLELGAHPLEKLSQAHPHIPCFDCCSTPHGRWTMKGRKSAISPIMLFVPQSRLLTATARKKRSGRVCLAGTILARFPRNALFLQFSFASLPAVV
jgi:hypothetical protein